MAGKVITKAIRAIRKGHQIKTRLLAKGTIAYILKRDGREKSFTILAQFNAYNLDIDRWRHSETIAFAVDIGEKFTVDGSTKTMRQISEIATHIAITSPDVDSVVYAIRTGDEYEPIFMDFEYKYYIKQVGDRFEPTENV